MQLNNDVLSIISLYADIPLKYNKNKLLVKTDNKCESCGKRMRKTHKSMVETYAFSKLLEIDEHFNEEKVKYIKVENTYIKVKKHMYSYTEAYRENIISYTDMFGFQTFSSIHNQIHGFFLTHNEPLKIYVKKGPSLKIFYKALREVLDIDNEKEFFKKLKHFLIKYDEQIMDKVLRKINVVNKPRRTVVRLCSHCRKRFKKGYIFQ